MNITKALCLPLLATLSLALGGAPAGAVQDHHPGGPPHGGGHGGWMPAGEDYYAPITVKACGSDVTIDTGDVREVLLKEKVKKDGSVVAKSRGGFTADITRASDGAFIDELDISGASTARISPDGTQTLVTLWGPSLLFATGPNFAAGLAAAGLPEMFYYERGKVTLLEEAAEDPEATDPASLEVIRNTARGGQDVCAMLDAAAAGS